MGDNEGGEDAMKHIIFDEARQDTVKDRGRPRLLKFRLTLWPIAVCWPLKKKNNKSSNGQKNSSWVSLER